MSPVRTPAQLEPRFVALRLWMEAQGRVARNGGSANDFARGDIPISRGGSERPGSEVRSVRRGRSAPGPQGPPLGEGGCRLRGRREVLRVRGRPERLNARIEADRNPAARGREGG